MGTRTTKRVRLTVVGAVAGLLLTACGGSDIKETDTAASGGKECGDFNMAINPWVGYEASAHVVGYVASSKLGCKVEYKDLKEEVAWQGFGSGEVDTVIENWGHDDLKKKYVEGNGTAKVVGPNGNIGQQVRRPLQDLRVRWQGPAARRRPVVRHQRRGARQEPQAELQGGLRGQ
jgi:glycine betaine/proline transport system substrate-binding protein